jgi:CDP-diacylglycerol---serine O-phosphatidyltransferase
MMKKFRLWIPSILTLGNLCCGVFTIFCDSTKTGLVLIICACVLDVLDGLSARLLKAQSEFGKQLDALADLVSFGIAPAYLIFWFLLPQNTFTAGMVSMIPIVSAVRLARFNSNDLQNKSFLGLPTPANGVFFASLPYLASYAEGIALNENSVSILIILFSLLMLVPLSMFSFKDLKSKGVRRTIPLLYLACLVPLIFIAGWWSIPLSVVLYILFSLAFHYFHAKNK